MKEKNRKYTLNFTMESVQDKMEKKFDKREDIKDKDWKREQGRLMREK